MKAKKILEEEIINMKISSLPTRPSRESIPGGHRFTSSEIKEYFDRLPLFIVERYNALIEDITCGALSAMIALDSEGYTLEELYRDVKSGAFADTLPVLDTTLTEYLLSLRADVDALLNKGGEAG